MSVTLKNLQLRQADFTLEVNATLNGRVTALFGASGSGKTTLLEIIAGLRRANAGTVSVDDVVLTDVSARIFVAPENRGVGYVPQEGALFPHLSVQKNLLYGRKAPLSGRAGLTFEHVVQVLEIAPLVKRAIGPLSGGEKQRVALGRALLASPRLLLLDEPLAGLDLPLRERLLPYLARVRDEFAIPILYVTHASEEVMTLCDDVLVLSGGRITRQGSPQEIFVRSDSPRYRLRNEV